MCEINDHEHTCDEYLLLFVKSGVTVAWEDYYDCEIQVTSSFGP
jgi:hypothetical protein